MTYEEACRVLGVTAEDSRETIKKKYHALISEVHPDAIGEEAEEVGKRVQNDAATVIAAYDFLIRKGGLEQKTKRKTWPRKRKNTPTQPVWDAPVNPQAYAPRAVYQYAEDQDGSPIGIYTAAEGKYYWKHDAEDFSLFLKSIMHLAADLITRCEEAGEIYPQDQRFTITKELIYLLAGQFTDVESGLEAFSKKTSMDTEGNKIYYLPAMLERGNIREMAVMPGKLSGRRKADRTFLPGEILHPLKIRDHRLYLGNRDGTPCGYMSFHDDRLYYVLIPMFENREVQVKIRVGDGKHTGFIPLELWVKKISGRNGIKENINSRIEKLLHNT